jgi:hypothetical protein
MVEIIISTQSLPFCLIENEPNGQAKLRIILAQASLILPKLILLVEYCISLAIDIFMNKYPDVTGYYSPIIYL